MADRVIHLKDGRQIVAPATRAPDIQIRERPRVRDGLSGATPRVALRAKGVSHTYAPRTPWAQEALHDVDIAVREADGLLVVGENGSGKTTLAWALAGLLKPTSGRCELDGRPILSQVGRVALSFQHARLQLQRPTLLADVRAASGADQAEAEKALALVGLDPGKFGPRPVEQLSGGQVRRAALAGLLARRPRVLILDEPFAGLDEEGRSGMVEILVGLRSAGRTLVVISHELHGLDQVCPTTVQLVNGRVVAAASDRSPLTLDDVGTT
jgi:energy-coupling factor transport system ATP-binding protein